MGKQIMLVNVHEDETRIALVENNILFGLHVQQTDRERKVGNIYRGRIVKINPAFQAAFVDYGESRNGFLSISDVNFNLHRPRDGEKGRPKIQSVLREGQPVMVQILKEGMSNKGSAMTTFISLAGRYMVMSPNSERSGVSRKIEDPDTRRRLKDLMEALTGGEDLGLIIRTAGIDQPVAELKKDLEALRKEWKSIQGKYDKEKKAGLLYQEPSPIVRVLRDYFTDGVQEVWVDDAEGFQEALRYFKSTLPKYQKRLKLYVGDKSLFSAYRIEEQIELLDTAKVALKSGGSIIIESTEAMVSVDVNSGRSNQAQDIEETALRTNMEAAEEIARQLRLRNLGGLIVIDFIDMMQAKNRRQVEKRVAEVLKDDKARTTIGAISQFGLLELSRQRIDMELSRGLRIHCPNCGGTGYIPTVNSSANNVLRKIRELAATGRYTEVHGELPLDAANFLLNEKREALRDLELEFEIALKLEADPELPAGHPITLHGFKPAEGTAEGDRRGERTEARVDERGESSAAAAADDGTRRRRRRRRRRRGGEEDGASESSRFINDSAGFEDADESELSDGDEPGLAADADLLDEELEVVDVSKEALPAEPLEGAPEAGERPRRGRGRGRGRDGDRDRESRPRRERPSGERAPAAASSNGGGGGGGGLVFRSEHIITDPEAVEKMPPRKVRSNPFKEISEGLPPNTVVFDSARLYDLPQPEAPAAKADAVESEAPAEDGEAGTDEPAKRKRRRSRSRRSGAKPAADAAATTAPMEAEDDLDALDARVNGNVAPPEPEPDLDEEDDGPQPESYDSPLLNPALAKGTQRRPRRSRSSAPSRANGRRPAAAKPAAGGTDAARKPRARRGRGRGRGRATGAGAASSAS